MWNPVPNLDVGLDVVWWHLNTGFAGFANFGQNGAKPGCAVGVACYKISDQDAVAAVPRTIATKSANLVQIGIFVSWPGEIGRLPRGSHHFTISRFRAGSSRGAAASPFMFSK